MFTKYLPLLGALVAAPASAVTVNMSDFTFGTPVSVMMSGTPSYDGAAGQFTGNMNDGLATDSVRFGSLDGASATSFIAWCAELTQSFSFGVSYNYTLVSGAAHFGTQTTTNLSRLFTGAQGFVVDNRTSAAMQAAIWEVIYETGTSFSLTAGAFRGVAQNTADQSAFNAVNAFLVNLGSYAPLARIDVLENGAQQDFLIPTIPEPETWALFAAGLGVIALLRRRRKG